MFSFILYLFMTATLLRATVEREKMEEYKGLVPFIEVSYTLPSGKKESVQLRFELFYDVTPLTCLNFVELLERAEGAGYMGTVFHRIINGFMMQGGDYTKHDGTGGRSIYGELFDDENFDKRHEKGSLSMANRGKNTNGSQFFITFAAQPHLDGRHVVFGKVWDADLDKVMRIAHVKTDTKDRPIHPVKVVRCGVADLRNYAL